MTVQEFYFAIGGSYNQALMTMMNDDFIKKMLSRFIEHNYYGYIKEAYNRKDFKAVFEAAHQMKGTAGNLGITPLYNGAAGICDLTRNLAPGQQVNLDTDLAVLKRDYDGIVSNIRMLMASF